MWIDWTNQRRRGIDSIDAIKTYAKEAIATAIELASAHIKNRRIGRSQRQRSDRLRLSVIKDRLPACAAIERSPDAALCRADVNLA